MKSVAALILGGITWTLSVVQAQAQRPDIRVGAGIVAPSGGAGEHRTWGPHTSISIGGPTTARVALRLDGEWSQLRAEGEGSTPTDPRLGALNAIGVSVNGILRAPGRISPYALIGIGAYRLDIEGSPNPYGTTVGLSAGAGMDVTVPGSIGLYVEVRSTLHATDYGVGDFGTSTLWPVVLGVRL